MNVSIVTLEPFSAYALQNQPGEPVPQTYERLWRWQASLGTPARYPVGLCFTGDGLMRYYAGLVFGEPVAPGEGVELIAVAGGLYASLRHTGPYDGIAQGFMQFETAWLPGSGYQADGRPALELYRNSPMTTRPEDLVTDLLLAIQS